MHITSASNRSLRSLRRAKASLLTKRQASHDLNSYKNYI